MAQHDRGVDAPCAPPTAHVPTIDPPPPGAVLGVWVPAVHGALDANAAPDVSGVSGTTMRHGSPGGRLGGDWINGHTAGRDRITVAWIDATGRESPVSQVPVPAADPVR